MADATERVTVGECHHCGGPLVDLRKRTGRPRRWCTRSCRDKAYRQRKRVVAAAAERDEA